MTYVKNGGFIRFVADSEVGRFAERGFAPIEVGTAKAAKKRPARSPEKEKPHGGA